VASWLKLEANVKEMQSARDREVQIATSEFAPMLSKIVTPLLALGTVGPDLYPVRRDHLCGCGCRVKRHLDLCLGCADLCGHNGVGILFWIERRKQGKERPA
jgi:hypothetical protein